MKVSKQPTVVVLFSMLLLLCMLVNGTRCFAFTASPVRTTLSVSFATNTISRKSQSTNFALSSTAPKKGFGSDTPEEKVKEAKPKTEGAQKRDEFSKKYDDIAAMGGQEYRIFVRQFGSTDQSWLPCGLIAVPRGSQVSTAIYSNVAELQKAIVRTYPKLKGMEQEFEYGYNLKIYPDDPIEVAKNTGPTNENMFSFGGWMKNLLSPIDTSTMPRPPPPP